MRTLQPTTNRQLQQNLSDAQKEDIHIMTLFPRLCEILTPYIGKTVLKADGNWIKKLEIPIHKTLAENKPTGVYIYFDIGRYAVFLRSSALRHFNLGATLCTISDGNNLEKIASYHPFYPGPIDDLMEKIKTTEKEAEEVYSRVKEINARIPGIMFIQ